MKKLVNLLLMLIVVQTTSCQTKKQETMQLLDRTQDYIIDTNKPKTGYYLQINNQNCHYKILVNDLLIHTYNDPYPAFSVRIPITPVILKSGEQKLSIVVLPNQGDELTRNTDITISLMRYADMSNQTDFGGSTTIMDWEMPAIQDKENLPMFRFDTIFKAEVPYEMNTINYATDLTKMDKDILLKEVVNQFELMHDYIKNDYDKFNVLAEERIKSSSVPNYKTDEDIRKVYSDNKKGFTEPENKKILQPLENYKMVLYGNGRIATLERLHDSGRIIWGKDTERGNEKFSLPLFIYKDTRDNQWHMW
ncbi:hypothetical protein [Empedobacter tilapiae]